MDFIYELRCDPAKGHPNLVLRYIVILLKYKDICIYFSHINIPGDKVLLYLVSAV